MLANLMRFFAALGMKHGINMAYNFFIKSKDDICATVEKFGFVPLFANSIKGFFIEENVSPHAWFYGNEVGV